MLHASKEGREKIGSVASWRESSLFDELERLVLDYAEAMTLSDRDVDEALFESLAQAFSPEQLVELTSWICLENFYSKFNRSFRVEGQGFCIL